MRVAIVGSRDYPDLERVRRHVKALAKKHPDAWIISGGARGVDREAEMAAEEFGLRVKSYRPFESQRGDFGISIWMSHDDGNPFEVVSERFPSYGAAAFFRNGLIVESADVVVAFHANGSRGTADSIRRARKLKRPVFIY
jgi:predicted Rossmann fold nucleotide-binding protein DprA/Smf involved in DNA uptake